MDLESVIEKVKKLRALAANAGTLQEAETAAALAETLIAKHRLDEAQIEADGGRPSEPINEEVEPLWSSTTRDESWRAKLAGGLTRHYGCFWFRSVTTQGRKTVSNVYRIIGRPSDVAIVRHMFAWLTAEIARLSRRERGRSGQNAFRLGAVSGLLSALESSAQKVERAHRGSAAIVLASRAAEATAAAKVLHPNIESTVRPTYYSDPGAYSRGREAGEGMHLGDKLPAARRALGPGPS
jgi:hypothetical protein